jgi:hypothetical protein
MDRNKEEIAENSWANTHNEFVEDFEEELDI